MRSLSFCLMLALVLAALETRAQEQAPAADDGPRSLAELAPAAIPDEENAAAQIEALAPLILAWDRDFARFSHTAVGNAVETVLELREELTDEQLAASLALLERHGELEKGVWAAAACTQYASLGDFQGGAQAFMDGLEERLARLRGVMRFVHFQVRVLSNAGRRDEAVRRGVDLLRLARLSQNEPTMNGFLVTVAVRLVIMPPLCDALAGGNISFDTQSSLEAELLLADNPDSFSTMLRSERAYATSKFPTAEIGLAVFPGDGLREYYDALVAASEGPWIEFRQQVRPGGKLGAPTGHGPLADSIAFPIHNVATAWGRCVATSRSLRAYNLLKLHAKLKKREAAGLEDLELPAEARVDPFTGKPLIARHTDEGWIVYSVGEDEQDDGGVFRKDSGVGLKVKAEK